MHASKGLINAHAHLYIYFTGEHMGEASNTRRMQNIVRRAWACTLHAVMVVLIMVYINNNWQLTIRRQMAWPAPIVAPNAWSCFLGDSLPTACLRTPFVFVANCPRAPVIALNDPTSYEYPDLHAPIFAQNLNDPAHVHNISGTMDLYNYAGMCTFQMVIDSPRACTLWILEFKVHSCMHSPLIPVFAPPIIKWGGWSEPK